MLAKHTGFDVLQSGLIVLDRYARVQHLNTAAQMLLRSPQSHAYDVPLTQWFDADETLKYIIRHIETGSETVYRCVLRLIRQGGGSELDNPLSVYAALSPMPMTEGENEPMYLLECFELGAYEQVQQDTQSRARTQSHQLLMRQLAHEIKNPLGGIRGATQLLQDELETLQPELVEYTEMVLGQVDRLKNLDRRRLIGSAITMSVFRRCARSPTICSNYCSISFKTQRKRCWARAIATTPKHLKSPCAPELRGIAW